MALGGHFTILRQEVGFLHTGDHLAMNAEVVRQTLLALLIEAYEDNAAGFVTLPRQTLDSSWARIVISELRNSGDVEEQVRGVVRLTTKGYKANKQPELHRSAELHLLTAV